MRIGYKLFAELYGPVEIVRQAVRAEEAGFDFVEISDAATAAITGEHMRSIAGCGPDAERHLEVVRQFVDAGYDHLSLINAGTEVDGFFDFFAQELGPQARELSKAPGA